MLEIIKYIIGRNAKAIAAYFAVLVTNLAAQFMFAIPDDVLIAAQGLVVALIVWLTANTKEL
jgi:hypothetical protein